MLSYSCELPHLPDRDADTITGCDDPVILSASFERSRIVTRYSHLGFYKRRWVGGFSLPSTKHTLPKTNRTPQLAVKQDRNRHDQEDRPHHVADRALTQRRL